MAASKFISDSLFMRAGARGRQVGAGTCRQGAAPNSESCRRRAIASFCSWFLIMGLGAGDGGWFVIGESFCGFGSGNSVDDDDGSEISTKDFFHDDLRALVLVI